MTTVHNGNPGDAHPPTRRLRFDTIATPRPVEPRARVRDHAHSGRRLVAAGVLTVLALWGGLYLAFRDWRARVHERIAYGTREVAATVDPLIRIAPPDVNPADWRQAVAETRAMLVTLTSANVLGLAEMEGLRAELRDRVARAVARPETASAELAAVWDDMAARAGHILDRHPRPKLLRPARKDEPQSTWREGERG
jgi:hypothetical protein